MTKAEEALKKYDDVMAKTIDAVAEKLAGITRTEALATHTCVSCLKPANEFRDEKSAVEWRITGLCQECQDDIFFEED